jgi:ribonuclease-3
MDEDVALGRLEGRLGHVFQHRDALRTALTHRSWAHEHAAREGQGEGPSSYNERLEFLGDSLLGNAAASLLFARFPEAREGELTRRRADLVCERTLARIASALEIGPLLRLGRGEDRTGGRDKPRLLASALEACIAAIALDGGTAAALLVAHRLLEPEVEQLAPGELDFKSRLQEREQAGGRPSPRYELRGADGPEHARVFHVIAVGETGRALGEGTGRSKAEAEQAAARAALETGPMQTHDKREKSAPPPGALR